MPCSTGHMIPCSTGWHMTSLDAITTWRLLGTATALATFTSLSCFNLIPPLLHMMPCSRPRVTPAALLCIAAATAAAAAAACPPLLLLLALDEVHSRPCAAVAQGGRARIPHRLAYVNGRSCLQLTRTPSAHRQQLTGSVCTDAVLGVQQSFWWCRVPKPSSNARTQWSFCSHAADGPLGPLCHHHPDLPPPEGRGQQSPPLPHSHLECKEGCIRWPYISVPEHLLGVRIAKEQAAVVYVVYARHHCNTQQCPVALAHGPPTLPHLSRDETHTNSSQGCSTLNSQRAAHPQLLAL